MSELLKCFREYGVSFKEKRFVFDPPPTPTKVEGEKPDEPVAPVEAPKLPYFYDPKTEMFTDPELKQTVKMKPAEAALRMLELDGKGYKENPEAAKVISEQIARKAALTDRTQMSFEIFGIKLGEGGYKNFANEIGLTGPVLGGEVPADFDFVKDVNSKSVEFANLLKDDKLENALVLAKKVPELEDYDRFKLKESLVNMYLASFGSSLQRKFDSEYKDFLKTKPADCKMTYRMVAISAGFKPEFNFVNTADQQEYDKYKAEKEAAAKVDPLTGKPAAASPEQLKHDDNAKAFAKTWVAKIMGFLGLLPMRKMMKDGKEIEVPDFDAVLKGEDPIAVALIGVCGGKNLLDNPAAYDEMKANLPAAQIAQLNSLEKRCETSPAYLGKVKPGEAKEGVIAAFDSVKFEKWVNETEKMPETGFTLNTSVKVADFKLKNLKLDLSGGGDITLAPKNFFTIEVDGKEEQFPKPADEKAKTLKENDLRGMKIVAIPSGTVFKGGVKPMPEKVVEASV